MFWLLDNSETITRKKKGTDMEMKDINKIEAMECGYGRSARSYAEEILNAIDWDGDGEFYDWRRWFGVFDCYHRYFKGSLKTEVRRLMVPSVYMSNAESFVMRWEFLKGVYDSWKEVSSEQ